MQYRRNRSPGGCYFFTVVTRARKPILTAYNTADVLRAAFRKVRQKHPFILNAIVLLPDHLHCIWTLPAGDANFSTRWRLIKTAFTQHCHPALSNHVKNETRSLWQHRYWEHTIRDDGDFRKHLDYLHYNPVKHGYVSRLKDWPHSSFHRFVAAGMYPEDWGSEPVEFSRIGHE